MAIRLTESRLRQIIREEASRLREGIWPPGPRQMPKPRKLLTYEWVTYAPDMEMEEMLALAKSNGITVVSTTPTGQMTEYYTDDDYGDAPEMEIVLHGQLPQFRKFYYADQDRRGDSAQSVESFDARELGISPVR